MNSKYNFEFTKTNAALHKKPEKNFPTRGVIAFYPMSILGCDLVDYNKIPRRGYKYILNCVDVFSRKAESALLKAKTGKEIQKGFNSVFERFGSKPKQIWFDEESGVVSKDTRAFLSGKNINLYHTWGNSKVAIAERFNRTQKSILYRYEMADSKNMWPDFIHQFTERYNDTSHRSLGMTPNEAFNGKRQEALKVNVARYYKGRKPPRETFDAGDAVRIIMKGGVFSKGYVEQWSREIYSIQKVLPTNPVTYVVQDKKGRHWQGSYYAQELQHVRDNRHDLL